MNNNDCKEMIVLIVYFFGVLLFAECIAVSRYGTLSAFFAKETQLVVSLALIALFTIVPAAGGAIASIIAAVIDEYKNREGIFQKIRR